MWLKNINFHNRKKNISSRTGAEKNKISNKNSYYRPYSEQKVILISDE